MQVSIHDTWNKGMGTELGALSVFLNLGVTTINVSSPRLYNLFNEYNQIFNIALDINLDSSITQGINPQDCFKLFSPYYVKKRELKTRKYIGLACYDTADRASTFNNDQHEWNYQKMYPLLDYEQIFRLIKLAGYDVITFDSKAITKKEKANIIENMCECVIGYEGGVAHLCHMLDVPFFMLPWRTDNLIKFQNHKIHKIEHVMHLDLKTYFFKTIKELHNYTPSNLVNQIELLKNNLGNNSLLQDKDLLAQDFCSFVSSAQKTLEFHQTEKEFLLKHCQSFKIGGLKELKNS